MDQQLAATKGWRLARSENFNWHCTSSTLIPKLDEYHMEHAEKVRARASEPVKDHEIAEKLEHWYPAWCKARTSVTITISRLLIIGTVFHKHPRNFHLRRWR
jgi:hypothetical protein